MNPRKQLKKAQDGSSSLSNCQFFCFQRSCSQMDVQTISRRGVCCTRSFSQFSRHAACQYVSGFTVLLQRDSHHVVSEITVMKHCCSRCLLGGRGCRSGKSACLPPMKPGFDSGPLPYHGGPSLLFLFSLGFPVFLPFAKTNTSNSSSTRIQDPQENHLRLMWLPL